MRATYRYLKSWVWAPKKKDETAEQAALVTDSGSKTKGNVNPILDETKEIPVAVVEKEEVISDESSNVSTSIEVHEETSHDLADVISWLQDLAKNPSPEQKIAISDLMDYIVMYKRLDMLKSPYASRLIQDELLMLAIFHHFYLDLHFENLFSLSLQDVLDGRATIQPTLNATAKVDIDGEPLSPHVICAIASKYTSAVELLNLVLPSDAKKRRRYQEVILNQLVNLIAEQETLFQRHPRFVATFKNKLAEFDALHVKLPWFWRSLF